MSNASSSRPVPEMSRRLPWQPLLGMIFIVVTFYGGQIIAGLILSLYPPLRGWSQAQADNWLAANSVLLQFLTILFSAVLVISTIRLYLRPHHLDLSYLGFKKPRWYYLLLGLSMIPLYYLTMGILLQIVPHIFPHINLNQKQEIGFDNVASLAEKVYTFISLVILAPLLEEIVFRGFIYKTLRQPLGVVLAGLITSALFGAGHLAEGGAAGLLYVGALQTFVLSLFLVWLRQKTHNLWAGIVLHASSNLAAFVYLFVLHGH